MLRRSIWIVPILTIACAESGADLLPPAPQDAGNTTEAKDGGTSVPPPRDGGPRCGDGITEPPVEQCDDGLNNSDVTPNACRRDCRLASCRDGVIDVGEVCYAAEQLFGGFFPVARGDVDGDGDLDNVIAAPDIETTFTVMLANGNGSFTVGASFSNPFGSGVIEDVTGDGRNDLIVRGYSTLDLWVFRGRGDGTFEDGLQLGDGRALTSRGAGRIRVLDFDVDGLKDILFAAPETGDIFVSWGTANGLAPLVPLPTPDIGQPMQLYDVGDYNGDGRPDVLFTSWYLSDGLDVGVLLQTETRGLVWVPVFEGDFGSVATVESNDLDGDGFLDLVLVSEEVLFLRGTQDSTAPFEAPLPLMDSRRVSSLEIVDAKSDGQVDVLVSSSRYDADDNVEAFVRRFGIDERGQWSLRTAYETIPGQAAVTARLGRFTDDDALDLAVLYANRTIGWTLEIQTIDPDGTITAQPPVVVSEAMNNFNVLDLDQDGRPELLGIGRASIEVAEDGRPIAPETAPGLQWPTAMLAVDVDGNGLLDVVSAAPHDEAWQVQLQTAPGVMGVPFEPSTRLGEPIAAGDLDGDGEPEIVTETDGLFTVYTISPSGRVTLSQPAAAGIGPLRMPDVDGDGTADILAGGAIHLGDANGGRSIAPMRGFRSEVDRAFVDVDGDGREDFVALAGVDVEVWLADDTGSFTSLPESLRANAFVVADFTTDGRPDLFLATNREWMLHPGVGDGTFAIDATFELPWAITPGDPVAGVAADADNDGDTDVFLMSFEEEGRYTQPFVVLLNDGRGDLSEVRAFGAHRGSTAGLFADLDGDGLLDVSTAAPEQRPGLGTFVVTPAFVTTYFATP